LWRTVSDPQIDAEAKRVVYVLGWNDQMADAMYSNLWVAATDASGERPLTQGNQRDFGPRWSPDGTRIAYLSTRGGKTQIRVRWMDSGQEAEITRLEQAPSNLAWSPDGRSLAYLAHVPSPPAWSVKLPEKPAGAVWAPPAIVATRLNWRRDGTGIRRPGFTHIFVVPATGGAPRQISTGDYDHHGEPAWMPDGKTILCAAQRYPEADYSLEGDEIYAFPAAGGEARQLTRRSGPDEVPVPSPDGGKIAYIGFDYQSQSYTVRKLYVMNADGSRPRPLSGSLDRDARCPRWSNDSRTVYFLADDRGGTHLYAARSDGTVSQVTRGRQRFGAYSGGSGDFSLAADGRVAAVSSTPSEPADVVTFPVDRPTETRRLTAANESLLAQRDIAPVEEIDYPTFDGKTIQGWVLKPPHFDAAKKYPLILDIHGGPHAMYGIEFNHQMQCYAARGYVVLYTNPRGSTGYGEHFGNVIHLNYPGDDYQDLMRGVDAMLAKGYIDPKRLAVTGGSGGGLLTAWIIGHTDRFAAAVSQYPVTDWITQAGSADLGYLFAALWMKAMPWENPEQYLKHSPIFFAQNFKTPTMVVTGEADYRTPIGQSEELYFALKARKVDAALVRIPDEPHGIRGAHPSHRIAKIEYILGWIDQYARSPLRGPPPRAAVGNQQ
jgi:acylaminoacyl-peptidase